MTLLSELIEIPHEVHKSDFVISLKSAIEQPERTIADYVVTPQLAECFDTALSLITSSVADAKSKSTYLHASFGAGKSAFMAVLHLLLAASRQPVPSPSSHRSSPSTTTVWPGGGFCSCHTRPSVPTRSSRWCSATTSSTYVLHPEAPLPAVYLSDDAQRMPAEAGRAGRRGVLPHPQRRRRQRRLG